ncbi:glycine cleavage system protein GcvH [Marinicrinis lubricantis]|uniref:Glycine cleavage system H protein n=1 Tax=Marinicrinis lubricantis TaxID=2086470 RepID=A0ABW1IQ80_9BACL
MNAPSQLKYSDEHVWVSVEGNKVKVGITEFAQSELGDIVFCELPKQGDKVEFGEPFGSVESVKTVSELYAPVTGTVVEVNDALEGSPEKINSSPYNEAWMIVIEMSDSSELDKLWSAEKYIETYSTE